MNRQRGMIPIGLIAYGLAALAILGAIYGVYRWIDRSWETTAGIERGTRDMKAKWDGAVALQREREVKQAAGALTNLEKANAKARVVYRTITRDVDRVVTRDVYRNVCLDDDGLRIARHAIRGESAAPGEPDKPVPELAGPRGRDGGIALALDRGGF